MPASTWKGSTLFVYTPDRQHLWNLETFLPLTRVWIPADRLEKRKMQPEGEAVVRTNWAHAKIDITFSEKDDQREKKGRGESGELRRRRVAVNDW